MVTCSVICEMQAGVGSKPTLEEVFHPFTVLQPFPHHRAVAIVQPLEGLPWKDLGLDFSVQQMSQGAGILGHATFLIMSYSGSMTKVFQFKLFLRCFKI